MQFLFRNRYFALAWVGSALLGAAAFVGKGGGHEQVDRTAQQLRAQSAALAQPDASVPSEAAEIQDEDVGVLDPTPVEDAVIVRGNDGKQYRELTRDEAEQIAGAAGQPAATGQPGSPAE